VEPEAYAIQRLGTCPDMDMVEVTGEAMAVVEAMEEDLLGEWRTLMVMTIQQAPIIIWIRLVNYRCLKAKRIQ
jgi:hypothetical protein